MAKGQYYAHPRNAFWPIAERLFGVGLDLPYPKRCARLARCGVGLWDVIASCERDGSLDSAIKQASVRVNNLAAWIADHPLEALALNGATAAKLFRSHCQPSLAELIAVRKIRVLAMPSTSPAHAAMSFDQKLERWSELTRP